MGELNKNRTTRWRTLWLPAGLAVAAVALAFFWLRPASEAAATDKEEKPVIVEMARAERRDVPINVEAIGTVQAYNSVLVRPRIDGRITRIRFTEGQDVTEGQVLAEIDARPLQAEVRRMRAMYARSAEQLANGRRDLQRLEDLAKQKLVARQVADSARSQVDQLEEAAAADRAGLDSAQLQLAEAVVRAPLAGHTGQRLIDAGNVVRAEDERGLVSIAQVHPISVVFSLSSDYLAQIRDRQRVAPLQVSAIDRDGTRVLAKGELVLIDNQVDSATGTIKFKATFANADDALWPGQFVNVRLLLETRSAAIVVPVAAVQNGPDGRYVYLAGSDDHIQLRPVTVSSCDTQVCVVAHGLADGERVVVDGQHKIDEGVLVAAVSEPKAANSTPAAAQ